jgi:hypothetical protein
MFSLSSATYWPRDTPPTFDELHVPTEAEADLLREVALALLTSFDRHATGFKVVHYPYGHVVGVSVPSTVKIKPKHLRAARRIKGVGQHWVEWDRTAGCFQVCVRINRHHQSSRTTTTTTTTTTKRNGLHSTAVAQRKRLKEG